MLLGPENFPRLEGSTVSQVQDRLGIVFLLGDVSNTFCRVRWLECSACSIRYSFFHLGVFYFKVSLEC